MSKNSIRHVYRALRRLKRSKLAPSQKLAEWRYGLDIWFGNRKHTFLWIQRNRFALKARKIKFFDFLAHTWFLSKNSIRHVYRALRRLKRSKLAPSQKLVEWRYGLDIWFGNRKHTFLWIQTTMLTIKARKIELFTFFGHTHFFYVFLCIFTYILRYMSHIA